MVLNNNGIPNDNTSIESIVSNGRLNKKIDTVNIKHSCNQKGKTYSAQ